MQRGLARWALALHSTQTSDGYSISPQKISQESATKKSEANSKQQVNNGDSDDDDDEGDLPVLGEKGSRDNSGPSRGVLDKNVDTLLGGPPPPFTPSIAKSLRKPAGAEVRPLPNTLSVAELRTRIAGKKKIK